jgi:hypothetical protein
MVITQSGSSIYMNRLLRLSPILWVVNPILYLYATKYKDIDTLSIIIILILSAISFILLEYLLEKTGIDKQKLPIYLSVGFLWLFSYEPCRSIFYRITESFLYENKYFILIWLVILLLCIVIIYKIFNNAINIIKFLAITGICMAGFNLICIAINITKYKPHKFNKKHLINTLRPIVLDNIDKDLPNIYYIILDEYPGAEELKHYFNFDNSDFIRNLENRGFFVANNSYSNYPWTELSVCCSLNMNYLNDINELDKKIIDNQTSFYLKRFGYNYIMLPEFLFNDFLSDFPFNNILRSLVKMTFLRKPLGENCFEGESHRKTILQQLKRLETMAQTKGPIFVYAHLLTPHRPYIFDQNGTSINFFSRFFQLSSDKELFLNQLRYTNKMIINLIDKIISESKILPIIIVQGDH